MRYNLLGQTGLYELDDNLDATKVKLSENNLNALNEVSQLPPEYLGWMLARQAEYLATPPVKE